MSSKNIAKTAILTALALVLGYVEYLIPIAPQIPGIKLGLSNLTVVFVLYSIDKKFAWTVLFLKILLSSLLFSGFQTFGYSLIGGILSLSGMIILKKLPFFSVLGVSAAGGVLHNTGQLIFALFVLNTPKLIYYLPPLIISGLLCGLFIGILCTLILKYIKYI